MDEVNNVGAIQRIEAAQAGELTALVELSVPYEPDEKLRAVLRRLPHLEKVTSDIGDVDLSEGV